MIFEEYESQDLKTQIISPYINFRQHPEIRTNSVLFSKNCRLTNQEKDPFLQFL